jgi:hypothetical protein
MLIYTVHKNTAKEIEKEKNNKLIIFLCSCLNKKKDSPKIFCGLRLAFNIFMTSI